MCPYHVRCSSLAPPHPFDLEVVLGGVYSGVGILPLLRNELLPVAIVFLRQALYVVTNATPISLFEIHGKNIATG